MKKVLVLAAALALFATPALAGIDNTKHDLSGGVLGSTIDEICVYCHTPHGADTTVVNAPLWNRTLADADATLYTGVDLNAVDHGYSQNGINQTDAPLCLSCHDGASLTTGLNNPPNSGLSVPTANIAPGAATNLGKDMSNDHPVGFNYSGVATDDLEINDKATVTTKSAGAVKFYGSNGDKMWCSSCHDVHNNTEAPFLNVTITGSELCLVCHAK